MKKLIAQGAEAKLYKQGRTIVKDRVKKTYRLPEIDTRLRKLRTRSEARMLARAARAGVKVPSVLHETKNKLTIEFVDGEKLRDWVEKASANQLKKIMFKLGDSVRKLHKADLIHGDLTTSNMILKGSDLHFIDFGLSQHSPRLEDKAVDIHLFKECLKSKHYQNWKICWNAFKTSYKNSKVLDQMRKVEARGRYKKL